MFNFTLTIDGQDEPVEVTATSRDVLMWEKTTKGASLAKLERDLRIGDMYALAWQAAKRHGHFTGDLEAFQTTVDLDFEDAKDGAEDPTRPAR